MPYNKDISNENDYEWYQCDCCPYGYHIVLDFVQYCETIGQPVERSGSIKRRKDRRRQRQSMEVLLGLAPPLVIAQKEPPLPPIRDIAKSPHIEDTLNDVVLDFERTLQRSKHKLSNNLPDVTAVSEIIRRVPSVTSMSSIGTSGSNMTILHSSGDGPGGRDFDTVSIESCGGLSPVALHNIREQMALSLERTKELEQLVQTLPTLQAQLQSLKEENQKLHMQLSEEEESKLNKLNSNYINSELINGSQLLVDSVDMKIPPPPPPRRDFGVMAGVLTRNVGVGHQTPHTRSVSTVTQAGNYVDRWYTEKSNFLNGTNLGTETSNKVNVSKGTQTIVAVKDKQDISTQTAVEVKPAIRDSYCQTSEIKKIYANIGINVTSPTKYAETQASVEVVSIGSSDNNINDVLCEKCSALRNTIGVGTSDLFKDPTNQNLLAISLASLSVPRSKSFNLGEEKLNHQVLKSVGCQYERNSFSSNKSSQSEIKTTTKHTQHELVQSHKQVQYENLTQTKCTDTAELSPILLHKSSECIEKKADTTEMGCNTTGDDACTKCSSNNKENEDVAKKEDPAQPSRIPRPQIPTTPVENRKFKRQDTYTKIPATEQSTTGLSALELITPKNSPDATSSFERFKPKLKPTEPVANIENGNNSATLPTEKKSQPTIPENTLCQSPTPRKKSTPSKEMQAAMKVLNDSLQKNYGRDVRGQLKNASALIETEWFKISSIVCADPVDVEDYLDSFEEMSSAVLEYIVNMVDASGNTAMHYAVSHGNFDVVSILLDSKVCDINKQNKAGYTSVMLVSLAEVASSTHGNVIRRLFSLADVNIRAKQHGQTALMLAVSHGRQDMVSMLLQAGADINIQDEDGSTALMCAAEHGHVEIVKLFLTQPDCDSSIMDVDGSTALKIAMEAGHRHIGILLYAHQRNIHGSVPARPKKSKSTSASPKAPSSPLMQRSSSRALPSNK